MCSPELIAVMCAGAVNLGAVRGGSGALLSKSELAGLLAGFSVVEMNLALAKYADDEIAKLKLFRNFQAQVTTFALREAWKPRDSATLAGLARLAVFEVLHDKLKLSGRERSEMVGIDHRQWARVWLPRYNLFFMWVTEVDSAIYRKLYRNNLG